MSKCAQLCRCVASYGFAVITLCVSPSVGLSQATPNQPPVAVDDLVLTRATRGEIIIPTLLANDTDPEDAASLTIVSVEQGTGGKVSLDSLKPTQVVFDPSAGFTGVYTFNYEIQDSGGLRSTASATVQNPFLQGKGTYAGAISGADAVPNSHGYVNLSVTSGGAFTGKLRFAGELVRLEGIFEMDGTYTADFQLTRKERRRIQLNFPMDGSGTPVTGVYSGGEQTIAFSLPRMNFKRSDPPPFSGAFNVAFLPPDEQKTTPAGIGYGILRVSTTGSATFSGKMGDAASVSFSGFTNPDGTVSAYATLYKQKGGVAAEFSFQEDGFVRVIGSASWFKPRIGGDRLYPKGFRKSLEATGAQYVASAAGSAPLQFPSLLSGVRNAKFAIEGAGFGKVMGQKITVPPLPASGRYEIEPPRPNRRKFSARIDNRTGLFAGTIRQPGTNSRRRFSGVLIQGFNFGAGVLDGANKTGPITLTPLDAAP